MVMYGYVWLFPTLTCGVFVCSSVSAPPPSRPSRPHSHSLTHPFTHSHTHSLARSLTHSHTHSLTHSLTHTHSLARSLTHSLPLLHGRRALRGRRGTMCTAKGSDLRPGVPLGLRFFCVAGVGQCALPRGPMYALASLGAPPLFRGRRGTMCTAQGADVAGLRLFCVPGVGQCALPRGLMYALASLGAPPLLRGRRRRTMCTAKGSNVRPGVPWVSASFAWQAWDNVHCQGVGFTPWRPLGLRLFCVAGVGQCALPRGPM